MSGMSAPRDSAVCEDSKDPARNAALAPLNVSGSSLFTIVGSPSNSVSTPVSSSPDAIRVTLAGKLVVASRSRISRPMRDPLPIKATIAIWRTMSAKLTLRFRRADAAKAAPQDAADAGDDSAGHIDTRHN